jgi:hypothetical protein
VFSEVPGSLRRDKGIQQALIRTIADKTPKSSDSGVFYTENTASGRRMSFRRSIV